MAVKRHAHLTAGPGWRALVGGSRIRVTSKQSAKKITQTDLQRSAERFVQALERAVAARDKSEARRLLPFAVRAVGKAEDTDGHTARVERIRPTLRWLLDDL